MTARPLRRGAVPKVGVLRRTTVIGILAAACSDSPSAPDPVSHPAFSITSPARASMLVQGGLGPDSVTIAGQVCDPRYPITALTLNGEAVPVSGSATCVPFNVKRESRWGLTVITGEAQNSRGTVSRLAQSLLRGPAYFPSATDSNNAARVPHALFAQLGQTAIDDGNRLNPDDIATLVQLALAGVDWNSGLPNPIAVSPDSNRDGNIDTRTYTCKLLPVTNHQTGYKITRGTPSYGPVVVTAQSVGGGLRTVVTLTNVSVPVTVFATLDSGCVGETNGTTSGSLTAASVAISVTTGVYPPGGGGSAPLAAVLDIAVQQTSTSVNLDMTPISFLGAGQSGITLLLADYLSSRGLDDLVRQIVPPYLGAVVQGFVPSTARLPLPGLRINAAFDTVAYTTVIMRLGSAIQVLPDPVRAGPAPARGALRSDGSPPTFSGFTFELGLGAKDDLLNQVFWAAWQHGAFDLPSASALGCDTTLPGGTTSLATFAELPPVLMPEAGDTVAIGLGDLRVSGAVPRSAVGGTGDPLQIALYGSAITRGTLGATATGALTFTAAQPPEAHLQITAIDDSSAIAGAHAALTPWFACVAQAVAQLAVQHLPRLEVSIPSSAGLPAGTVWRLPAPSVKRESTYTTLRGTLAPLP